MQPPQKTGIKPWSEVFALRHQYDVMKPFHVQVVDACASVNHARAGDELFLHEITTNEISLKLHEACTPSTKENSRRRSSLSFDRTFNAEEDLEVLLPSNYNGSFILYPRHPLSHCFLSVQEILNALPAVSKLIYPAEGFKVNMEVVKAMERLEIVDQIRDPSKGTEILCVRSMKTESQMLLSGTMKTPFVQLSNECYKCGPEGIPATELIMRWKPGQPPFQVKFCPPKPKLELNSGVQKTGKQKKDKKTKEDKKDKKKNRSSWCVDVERLKTDAATTAEDAESSLIPSSWKDKMLLMKPFQRIRVKNIMFDAKDFTLPENAKLTVKILSAGDQLSSEKARELRNKRDRLFSASGRYSGPLAELPVWLVARSNEPLLLMVTDGDMATVLRQQLKISQGCRLAVHEVKQSKKILMTCQKTQYFLVSLSYSGTFRRYSDDMNTPDFKTNTFLTTSLPCTVKMESEDKRLGYDQLYRRNVLTALEILTETTLCVEMFGADGQVVSEHPFEIPLSRTNLSVSVLDGKSYTLTGMVSMERVRRLPSVEFITEEQIKVLKNSEAHFYDMQPILQTLSPELTIPTSRPAGQSGPHEDLYSSPNKRRTNGNCNGGSDPPDTAAVPPRPPKSPGLSHQSHLVPPARPPKPDRFKEFPEKSLNFNFNNNVIGDVEQIKAADRIKIRAQEVRDMQMKMKRTSVQDLESYLKESRKLLSPGDKSSLTMPDKSSNQQPIVPPRPAPRKTMSKANSFEGYHDQFNPALFVAKEPLVEIEEESSNDSTAATVTDNLRDVGIYGDNGIKPRDSGFKLALERAIRNRNKRGVSMVNPNYGMKIGEEIRDPALTKNAEEDENEAEDESIYDFATDVIASSRGMLPSFVDDDDDYENPMSPSQNTPVKEDEYTCMTQGSLQRGMQMPHSANAEDDYETMDYEIPPDAL